MDDCAVTRTWYVRRQDKGRALRPGETYSNATEAVGRVVRLLLVMAVVVLVFGSEDDVHAELVFFTAVRVHASYYNKSAAVRGRLPAPAAPPNCRA